MTDLPIPVSVYAGGVNRDYATIYADLLRHAEVICPEWTYHGEDDPGSAILQLQAYLADHLHHRADTTLRDLLLAKTRYRDIARQIAERSGYLAQRPTPAVVDVTVSIEEALATDLEIPARTVFSAAISSGTVYFENLSPGVTSAGGTSTTLSLTEGRTAPTTSLGIATGKPWERFALTPSSVLFNWADDDLTIEVDGIEATHFRWPRDATPDDLAYWVRATSAGGLQVRFGNGSHGRLLTSGAVVSVTYRQGGGIRGNVIPGAISNVVSTVLYEGSPIALTVTNANRAIGGQAEEPLLEIQQSSPAFYRSQDRAVTLDDYESVALGVAGIFRAKVVAAGVNGVITYVVPNGAEEGDVLSEALREAVQTALDAKRMATDHASVRMATLVPIDVEVDIVVHRNQRRNAVRERARDALLTDETGYLAPESNDLGQRLNQSDMIAIVEAVDGVDYLDVNQFTRRPRLTWASRTGDADLSSDGVTVTARAQEQTWSLYFTSPTEFTASGSVSGLQTQTGELDTAYSDDAGEAAFTIEAGSVAMAEGDRGYIAVSPLVGNIRLGAKEFPVVGSVIVNVSGGIA